MWLWFTSPSISRTFAAFFDIVRGCVVDASASGPLIPNRVYHQSLMMIPSWRNRPVSVSRLALVSAGVSRAPVQVEARANRRRHKAKARKQGAWTQPAPAPGAAAAPYPIPAPAPTSSSRSAPTATNLIRDTHNGVTYCIPRLPSYNTPDCTIVPLTCAGQAHDIKLSRDAKVNFIVWQQQQLMAQYAAAETEQELNKQAQAVSPCVTQQDTLLLTRVTTVNQAQQARSGSSRSAAAAPAAPSTVNPPPTGFVSRQQKGTPAAPAGAMGAAASGSVIRIRRPSAAELANRLQKQQNGSASGAVAAHSSMQPGAAAAAAAGRPSAKEGTRHSTVPVYSSRSSGHVVPTVRASAAAAAAAAAAASSSAVNFRALSGAVPAAAAASAVPDLIQPSSGPVWMMADGTMPTAGAMAYTADKHRSRGSMAAGAAHTAGAASGTASMCSASPHSSSSSSSSSSSRAALPAADASVLTAGAAAFLLATAAVTADVQVMSESTAAVQDGGSCVYASGAVAVLHCQTSSKGAAAPGGPALLSAAGVMRTAGAMAFERSTASNTPSPPAAASAFASARTQLSDGASAFISTHSSSSSSSPAYPSMDGHVKTAGAMAFTHSNNSSNSATRHLPASGSSSRGSGSGPALLARDGSVLTAGAAAFLAAQSESHTHERVGAHVMA